MSPRAVPFTPIASAAATRALARSHWPFRAACLTAPEALRASVALHWACLPASVQRLRGPLTPVALPLDRKDEDLRLAVDQALSLLYRSDRFRDIYRKWFGEPDEATIDRFRAYALPD